MRLYLGGYLTFFTGGQPWLEVDLPAPAPLRDVLQRVSLPAGEVFIVVVNGTVVDLAEAQVSPSDEVRLYPPADGGALA